MATTMTMTTTVVDNVSPPFHLRKKKVLCSPPADDPLPLPTPQYPHSSGNTGTTTITHGDTSGTKVVGGHHNSNGNSGTTTTTITTRVAGAPPHWQWQQVHYHHSNQGCEGATTTTMAAGASPPTHHQHLWIVHLFVHYLNFIGCVISNPNVNGWIIIIFSISNLLLWNKFSSGFVLFLWFGFIYLLAVVKLRIIFFISSVLLHDKVLKVTLHFWALAMRLV